MNGGLCAVISFCRTQGKTERETRKRGRVPSGRWTKILTGWVGAEGSKDKWEIWKIREI